MLIPVTLSGSSHSTPQLVSKAMDAAASLILACSKQTGSCVCMSDAEVQGARRLASSVSNENSPGEGRGSNNALRGFTRPGVRDGDDIQLQ